MTSPLPAPGYYPDPQASAGSGTERWWDGRAWTSMTRTAAEAATDAAFEDESVTHLPPRWFFIVPRVFQTGFACVFLVVTVRMLAVPSLLKAVFCLLPAILVVVNLARIVAWSTGDSLEGGLLARVRAWDVHRLFIKQGRKV